MCLGEGAAVRRRPHQEQLLWVYLCKTADCSYDVERSMFRNLAVACVLHTIVSAESSALGCLVAFLSAAFCNDESLKNSLISLARSRLSFGSHVAMSYPFHLTKKLSQS